MSKQQQHEGESILVTMYFRRKNASPLKLNIGVYDDPLSLATEFATINNLPLTTISKLRDQIIHHKNVALSDQSQDIMDEPIPCVSDARVSDVEPAMDAENEEQIYDSLREKWTQNVSTNISRNRITPFSRTQSLSSRPRSQSAPPKLSLIKEGEKRHIYDRLYSEANRSKARLDKLREKILLERSHNIKETSFREMLKRRASTPKRSHSNPRATFSPPKSPSSSIPLPNQQVFDKLYNYSHFARLRLDSLRERLETEEKLAIDRNSVRLTHILTPLCSK